MNQLPSELADRLPWPGPLWFAGRSEMTEFVLVCLRQRSRTGTAHVTCFPKRNWLNMHDAKNMIAQQSALILGLPCFQFELLTKLLSAARGRFQLRHCLDLNWDRTR